MNWEILRAFLITIFCHYILNANIFHYVCSFFYFSLSCGKPRSFCNSWTANWNYSWPCVVWISPSTERFLLVHKFSYWLFYKYQWCAFQILAYCQVWHLAISPIHYFLPYSLTLILTASLELTNKWHLWALLFNKLFSNHSNKAFDAFSKDVITTLMSSATIYEALSSA